MTTQNLNRTRDQRLAGLAKANRIRTYRSEVKRNLRAGADAAPILRDPPAELHSMQVAQFLRAIPKHGRVKVAALMRTHGISPVKTLGGLSDRQRGVLVEALTR